MNDFKDILEPKVQEFIKAHENDDIVDLILKGSSFKNIEIQQIAQQIKGRQVAKHKFADLYDVENIVYPPKLNLEQASSQETADYKVNLMSLGNSIIDLTGGFGIDTLAFASKFKNVTYFEMVKETYDYATHNFNVLDKKIKTHQTDGINYLMNCNANFDWIYIDPARRDEFSKKVFRLEDCTPNILEHLDLFKSKSNCIMVKTSPLLDINLCIKQMPEICEIHIVAYKNEVKELLLVLDFKSVKTGTKIAAVNIGTQQKYFINNFDEFGLEQEFSLPKKYLYEPNAAIMKSGFFGGLCHEYKVSALAMNSHLFTSENLIEFPGRRFEIKNIISPKKKEIKKFLSSNQANISTRNYPLKPLQIKAKYVLKDGGDDYVFFTTNYRNEKIVLICEKINLK